MSGDAEYFKMRAAEQTQAAEAAAHINAKTAHLELALRYELLASAILTQEASLTPRV